MVRIADIAKRGRAASEQAVRLSSEELDARAAETAKRFLDATIESNAAHDPEALTENRADAEQDIARTLRGLVTDALTIVTPLAAGPEEIDETERERQIVRGALAKLTKAELQRAAAQAGLKRSGTKEQVLDRLGGQLGGDTRAAAALINSVDRHPSEGRRHATRLFPFDQLPEPTVVSEKLQPYVRRYVRTDLANWFVLTQADSPDSELRIAGHLRSYDITVRSADVEAQGENHPVLMCLSDDQVLKVSSLREDEAIAGVEALSYLVEQLPVLPLGLVARQQPSWRSAGQLRLQTNWMLGLFLRLLEERDMTLVDVTSVSFERSRGDRSTPLSADTPHVGSARLRGQHVLDSQSACKHVAGLEQLHAVSAMVRFREEDGTHLLLPIRVAVEQSYVAVMTGFGGVGAERSRPLHHRFEAFVAQQLTAPTFDPEQLARVVDAMLARATDPEPPEHANLFARSQTARVHVERA